MKKLLVLALVLSMATMASAALQISVGGLHDVDAVTITMVPSGSLTLDIWTDAAILPGVGEGYFALVGATAQVSIIGGVSLFPTETGIVIMDDVSGMGGFPGMVAGENGVTGGIALGTIPSVPIGSTIFDLITLHCEGPGVTIVNLIWTTDFVTGTVIDTLAVTQVPEPITMALLGLGGLFLRRRSK